MARKEYTPEEWPDVRGDYERLVALARRRLVGFEHHAEDVVTRALMKWAKIPAHKKPVARIEQVIKTEAYSLIRSEQRLHDREQKVARDPTLRSGNAGTADEIDRRLLRRAIVQECKNHQVTVTASDVEVLELLFAGYSLSAIVNHSGLSRHEVKKSRAKWRTILARITVM
jgi:hypothetical protein